ncbi:M14 family zinc carboxypeptidase [Acuticoccus sp.]|uniref:M14 family zinc carboxypeptidase n=1 Tax=Acuticoccus sp. TaxID=1904378 RepID=UPI003B52D548
MNIIRGLDAPTAVQTVHLALFGDEVPLAELDFLTENANLGRLAAVRSLADAYIAGDDFQESYAGSGPEAFVRALFFNLFDRNASIREAERWTTRLENGLDDAKLLFRVLNNASEADLEAWRSKLFIADYFTEQEAVDGYVPDQLTFQELTPNAELYAELEELDERSDDLSLEVIGASLDGRPLYAATVGTGATKVLFITQQHGDEPIGTESALYLLDFLTGDSELAQQIRSELTVVVVPRVNPDGFERLEQEIGGVRGLVDPRLNDNAQDLNRTYDPDDPFSVSFAPESVAVRRLAEALDPDLLLDYHGQGNYRTDDGDLVTLSVLWPTNEGVDPAVVEDAKKAVAAIVQSVEGNGFSEITLYPGSDNPAIARNGFSLRDVPTILVEQRFGSETFALSRGLDLDYSALISALALEGFITMKGLLETIAEGEFEALDTAVADALPERPPFLPYGDLYGDDAYVTETAFV